MSKLSITQPEQAGKLKTGKSESKEIFSFFQTENKSSDPIKSEPVEIKPLKKFEDLAYWLATSSFQLMMHNCICRGVSGTYSLHSYKDDNIAMKTLNTLKHDSICEWKDFEYEAQMTYYAQQASDKVVKLKKVFFSEKDGFSLGFEYIPNCVENLITKHPEKLSWPTRLSIALDIAKALKGLHAYKILHTNIRSHHVLYDPTKKVAKLVDFRHAYFENHSSIPSSGETLENNQKNWHAPEEHDDKAVRSSATNIYQFGNFLFELVTGSRPLGGNVPTKISKAMDTIQTSKIPSSILTPIKDIIKSCWSDQTKRPTAAQLEEKLTALLPEETYHCSFPPEVSIWEQSSTFPGEIRTSSSTATSQSSSSNVKTGLQGLTKF